MSSEESSVLCFCKKPAKTFSTKEGNTMVRCGVVLDYEKIGKKLQKLKTKKERRGALKKMTLGCNMNLKLSDAKELNSVQDWSFTTFPKCDHCLYAKLGISHPKHNDGKAFWACPVQYPDIGCGFFQWTVNQDESESTSSSEDEVTTSKSQKKIKKKSKGKRRSESSDEEKNSSESESENESPRLKRRCTN